MCDGRNRRTSGARGRIVSHRSANLERTQFPLRPSANDAGSAPFRLSISAACISLSRPLKRLTPEGSAMSVTGMYVDCQIYSLLFVASPKAVSLLTQVNHLARSWQVGGGTGPALDTSLDMGCHIRVFKLQ